MYLDNLQGVTKHRAYIKT